MSAKISRRTLAKKIAQELTTTKDSGLLAKRIAAYLLEHKMTDQLDMLLGDIAYELSQKGTHLQVGVTSAHELSGTLKADIRQHLRMRYKNMPVEIIEKTDPDLVGGVVITTPDEALDLSVRAKLKRLRQA